MRRIPFIIQKTAKTHHVFSVAWKFNYPRWGRIELLLLCRHYTNIQPNRNLDDPNYNIILRITIVDIDKSCRNQKFILDIPASLDCIVANRYILDNIRSNFKRLVGDGTTGFHGAFCGDSDCAPHFVSFERLV